MRAVNRQPWYPQRRGWAQVRTPQNPLSRPPRQPPEEHLGAPPPLRSKLRLRQGAISNENAALAGRRARFQGIGFFKASGGKVGGRKHTLSATNLREFGHRSRRDPPEASMFVLRRRGFSTRKLSSDPCDTTHPTTPWATQPQPSQPESEETQKADTGRIWCHLRGKPSTMVCPKARLGPGAHTQKSTEQGAQATARGAPGSSSSAGEKEAAPAPGCHFQ